LGRTMSVFLGDGSLEASAFRGTDVQRAAMVRACQTDPSARFQSVAALVQDWHGV